MIRIEDYDTMQFNEVDPSFFAKYIGKDVWFACRWDYESVGGTIIWVNPKQLTGQGELTKLIYFYVDNDWLLEPESVCPEDIRDFREAARWDYVYNVLVSDPVEVLNTDDIYDIVGGYID